MQLTRALARHRLLAPGALGLALVAAVLTAPSAQAAPAASTAAAAPSATAGSGAEHRPGRLAAHGSAAPSGWSSVTLQLAPDRPADLAALAQASGVPAQSRRAAVAAAGPSAATASAVADFLTRTGLKVTDRTTFSITAHGPAALVASVFPKGVTSPLAVPAALRGLVTYAVGSADTRPVAHPLFTAQPIDADDARALYSVPAGSTTKSGMGITVATIQLSGWDDTDLTLFARDLLPAALPDPVASGQYQAVSVDGADPSLPDTNSGDFEVALDQESLLAVAPKANQVAYFAHNTLAGFTAAFNAVADDALNNTAGLKYTALSVSWGSCEPHWSIPGMQMMSAAIQNVVAAGVTVFVASGDQGAYDCSNTVTPDDSLAVDFPASDPNSIAVGGLTTDPVLRTERTWWEPSGVAKPGYLGRGGGGGVSTQFAQPSWQAGLVAGSTKRLVPDLSLDADPNSGYQIVSEGFSWLAGGTSLGAPLAAATLTDLQIVDGASRSYGLGNISRALYAAPRSSYRDTTAGTNGFYTAVAGYDLATGLGAPQWSKLDSAILGHPILSVPATSYTWTFPITVTAPAGMTYTGYKAGVGAASEPATCNASGSTASPPTSVTVGQGGPAVVWVMAYAAFGHCFLTESPPVDVRTVGPSSGFAPTGPCRVFDTRTGDGDCSGAGTVPQAPVGTGATLKVKVVGVAGVPADATAVVLNLTAVDATVSTVITAWPDGQVRPGTSNINAHNASSVPNLAIVPVGLGGTIDLYNANGTVNLIGDISGYFAPSAASMFASTGPCRVFDTRTGGGDCLGALAIPQAGVGSTPLTVHVAGIAGVPSNATAVVLNLTAVDASVSTVVTAGPSGAARPGTSNLNAHTAASVPNLAIVPIGTGGNIDLYNANGTVNLIGDISGYFAPSADSTFSSTGPCRVFDTRTGGGSCPGSLAVAKAQVGTDTALRVKIAGVAGIPANATAVVLNLTAVDATRSTVITAGPDGQARPGTSNLNAHNASSVPNLAIVPIGSNGYIDLYNLNGTVHLIGDVSGFFAP